MPRFDAIVIGTGLRLRGAWSRPAAKIAVVARRYLPPAMLRDLRESE